jgi:hypothetical protein
MIPELLGQEQDNQNNSIQIFRVDSIAMSPVYTFFIRQMAELIDKGFGFPVTSWDDSCGAVYAMQDNKILGHIVYDSRKEGSLWITLSAVDESCRGRGIYTILHKYFEQTAREKKCWLISSHVHVKNSIRLKSAEKVGMKPVFYFMAKKL